MADLYPKQTDKDINEAIEVVKRMLPVHYEHWVPSWYDPCNKLLLKIKMAHSMSACLSLVYDMPVFAINEALGVNELRRQYGEMIDRMLDIDGVGMDGGAESL